MAKPQSIDDAKQRIRDVLNLTSSTCLIFSKLGNRTVQIIDQAAWDMVSHLSEVWTVARYPGAQETTALHHERPRGGTYRERSEEDSSDCEEAEPNVVSIVVVTQSTSKCFLHTLYCQHITLTIGHHIRSGKAAYVQRRRNQKHRRKS